MQIKRETSRTTVLVAVSLCAAVLCVWAVVLSRRKPPVDRRVVNVALSGTGNWLAAGTAEGKIAVWNQSGGASPQQITFPYGALNDLRFSPDERTLAIAAGNLGLYLIAESVAPRLLRSDFENYGSVRFSPDGQTLLVVNGAGLIETMDARSGAVRLKLCCSSIYGEAVFTPDGQAIANSGHWPSLWDSRSGTLLARLTANREFETFRPIAFNDRDAILMGSQDGRVYAWDLRTRQRVAISPPQSAYVDTLAVSSTGWVVFAGSGSIVELWNPATGQQRSIAAARPTSNIVLGPDGASVIFGTASGDIEFWDIRTERRIRSLKIPGK